MTTKLRPRFWCLLWQTCGYNGESLAELIAHHEREHATRFMSVEWAERQAFMAAGRRAWQMAKDIQADVDQILQRKS